MKPTFIKFVLKNKIYRLEYFTVKMYKVILLVLLLTTTDAEALYKTNNDCAFNKSSKITSQKLLYCRYIRDDWDSNDISISELNFYYKLQFKLEKNRRKYFMITFIMYAIALTLKAYSISC